MRTDLSLATPLFPSHSEAAEAAQRGDLDGMLALAGHLRRVDPANAESWLRFALAKAIVFADESRRGTIQLALADLMLARGEIGEGRAMLEASAEAGEPGAMRRLADLVGEDELELDFACFLRGCAQRLDLRIN
jgi:hypothetical protein